MILITGQSKYGKSTLARQLGGRQIVTIETDAVLRRLLDSMQRPDTPILKVLQQFREVGSRSFSQMTEAIVDAGLADDLGAILAAHVPLDEPTVLVEGYGLRGEIQASLIRHLDGKAWVWKTERLSADDTPSRSGRDQAETIELLRWKLARAEAVRRPLPEVAEPAQGDPDGQFAALRRERDAALRERNAVQAQLDRLTTRRSVRAALRLSALSRSITRGLRN